MTVAPESDEISIDVRGVHRRPLGVQRLRVPPGRARAHPELPFVLFTGKGSEEVASDAISAGVTDYLQKGGTGQFAVLANRIGHLVRQYVEVLTIDGRTSHWQTRLAPVVENDEVIQLVGATRPMNGSERREPALQR